METNTNIGVLLTIFLLLIFLGYRKIVKDHNFFSQRGIAFIKPKIFFGNMFESFLEFENQEVLLKRFYNDFKREKLFGIFMFLRPIIIAKDVELIKKITVTHSTQFHNRDRSSLDDLLSKSIYNLEGSQWLHTKIAIAPFFEESAIKIFYSNISLCADDFMRMLDKKRSSSNDNELVIDTKTVIEEFLSNVIALIILGKGIVYGERNAVYEIAKRIEEDLKSLRGGIKIFFMTHFPVISEFFDMKIFSKEIYDFFREHVTEEIKNRKRRKVDKDKNRQDFVQFLMNTNNHLDDVTINAQIFSFFVSGFSPISKLFQLCCYELAKNERIQNELYEEIRNENDFLRNYKNLKILDKIILETLRKWPPINNLNRICNQNCTIELKNGEKYRFFKNDFIKIPLNLIQNDHELFYDPNYFNPHRFDSDDGEKNLNIIFPFGIGERACLCSEIAIFQVKLVLFEITRKYLILQSQKTATPVGCSFLSDSNAICVRIKLRTK
ncbi:hypothetical protein PVAND_001581 [Polypedilum vanderplanki]|uniref:Cytochrome P450 n=1 Tax=Polypedilum vanderplanki TaxID=319348 RepID=A0A9J6BND5_POLVA|nr:hypothetical protein PVAND_001581 [Polypedilum vanderplanki]